MHPPFRRTRVRASTPLKHTIPNISAAANSLLQAAAVITCPLRSFTSSSEHFQGIRRARIGLGYWAALTCAAISPSSSLNLLYIGIGGDRLLLHKAQEPASLECGFGPRRPVVPLLRHKVLHKTRFRDVVGWLRADADLRCTRVAWSTSQHLCGPGCPLPRPMKAHLHTCSLRMTIVCAVCVRISAVFDAIRYSHHPIPVHATVVLVSSNTTRTMLAPLSAIYSYNIVCEHCWLRLALLAACRLPFLVFSPQSDRSRAAMTSLDKGKGPATFGAIGASDGSIGATMVYQQPWCVILYESRRVEWLRWRRTR